ncbi:MAG TPA: DUF5050 domain-containing protein [Myxococcota bacterium]|nr:DUF5050 domain-containing protein [Myxococcota bacterium]
MADINHIRVVALLPVLVVPVLFLSSCDLFSDGEVTPSPDPFEWGSAMAVAGNKIFISDGLASPDGAILLMDLDAAGFQTVVDGLDNPTCLITDGEYVYWVEDNPDGAGALRKAVAEGGHGTAIDMAVGLDSPYTLVLNSQYVFFTDKVDADNTAINRIPRAGGDVVTLTTLRADYVNLAADEQWVYFTAPYDNPNGYIARVPVEGGATETVVGGLGAPVSLALRAGKLCWVEIMGGEVACIPDADNDRTPYYLTTDESVSFGPCQGMLLLHEDGTYWISSVSGTQDGVRVASRGVEPVTLVKSDAFGTITGMGFVDETLYFIELDGLYRVTSGE